MKQSKKLLKLNKRIAMYERYIKRVRKKIARYEGYIKRVKKWIKEDKAEMKHIRTMEISHTELLAYRKKMK